MKRKAVVEVGVMMMMTIREGNNRSHSWRWFCWFPPARGGAFTSRSVSDLSLGCCLRQLVTTTGLKTGRLGEVETQPESSVGTFRSSVGPPPKAPFPITEAPHLQPWLPHAADTEERPRKLLKAWKGQSPEEMCSFLSVISIY